MIKLPNIIGLCGRRQNGKDSSAKIMEKWGYRRLAFADPLKEMAVAIDPIIRYDIDGVPVRLSYLVKEYGWEYAKSVPEIRGLLMRLGTEAVRHCLWDRVWIDALERKIDKYLANNERIVITDVRFVNEAMFIREKSPNSQIWRIVRPGFNTDATGHVSENELDQIVVDNTIIAIDIPQLSETIEQILGGYEI